MIVATMTVWPLGVALLMVLMAVSMAALVEAGVVAASDEAVFAPTLVDDCKSDGKMWSGHD